MAGNRAISRDLETEVVSSSGSRRRRLPDIPPRKIAAAGNRIGGFLGNRDDLAAEKNGSDDAGKYIKSSNGDDLQLQFTGSKNRLSESGVTWIDRPQRCSELVKRVQDARFSSELTEVFANTLDQELSAEDDGGLRFVEGRSPANDDENHGPPRSIGGHQPSGTGARCPRPTLFALVNTCRIVPVTLGIPRRVHADDFINDDIQLIETDVSGAATIGDPGSRRRSVGQRHVGASLSSAFMPVGQAASTRRLAAESSFKAADAKLVVVSSVCQHMKDIPGSSQQLRPGDILLEAWWFL